MRRERDPMDFLTDKQVAAAVQEMARAFRAMAASVGVGSSD